MIDYEVKIFNNVYNAVAPMCAKNSVRSTPNEAPPALPAVALWEMDNATVRRLQSSTPTENYALITYQLEVYAGKKETCRGIFKAADDAMISMNFNRMSGQYITNVDNIKVVRYVARYEAIIDKDGNLYRRR